ncbi:DinB family protein [Flavobacterium humi]|uniref:DinB family protein n=1 Tax=Flavobacterium humi TaxID=2562683 RepID=A0A4Z0LCK5_9FLAO|nr:DinB family protein [Flavobacterium humi]TGD59611.1 DinB family protein [Flavobacterium humi]
MKNLLETDYAPYYSLYIDQVEEEDCIEALEENMTDFVQFIEDIPSEKHEYRYQPEKWSIKEIVQHIIDAERIFAYRALRFARFDKTPVPGFEENDYVPVSESDKREMSDLLQEFLLVRKSTIKLFESFSEGMLSNKGTASGHEIKVLALGFIISGHAIHHQKVIRERYLK